MCDIDARFALLRQQLIIATDKQDISKLLTLERQLRKLPVPSASTLSITGIGRAVAARRLRTIRDKGVGVKYRY